MEPVSAFAAYQSAASKTVTNKKSNKGKKQKKTNDEHVVQLTSKQHKKVCDCYTILRNTVWLFERM